MAAYAAVYFALGFLLIAFDTPGGQRVPFAVVPIIWAFASVPLLAAIGVLGRRPRGRTMALAAAGVRLLTIPIGTALGSYTLWVLTRPGAPRPFSPP